MDYKKLENAVGDPAEYEYVRADSDGGECACGKKNIVYRYHLKNTNSGKWIIVGSECINYFETTPQYEVLVDADKSNRARHKWIKEMKKTCETYIPLAEKEIEKLTARDSGHSIEAITRSEKVGIENAKKFIAGEFVEKDKLRQITNFVALRG